MADRDEESAILRARRERLRDVICPIHGERPKIELADDGSVSERYCCDGLLQIVWELEGKDPNPPGVDIT